jgi:hypothetical protein
LGVVVGCLRNIARAVNGKFVSFFFLFPFLLPVSTPFQAQMMGEFVEHPKIC